jgi:proteasome lid subunit RPN8/RPN11
MSSIRVHRHAWEAMLAHARAAYPDECCGAMLGRGGEVRVAAPLENSFAGSRRTRYQVSPEDLLAATRAARQGGLQLIGIYHSHPDRDACFSETDLKNSCPWYAFLILSIKAGVFDHAACWQPNPEQTQATRTELDLPV